ncbi:MAG: DUF3604 domain-containing protein [Verrucomicrobia bacterium]|nr:DUF3604 domain-containing protein [Verrucomicrobiota bacterium]MBS0637912.1 DUF3604 domain-containing protein [Verrucomicrobiota bacterium]
MRRSICYFEPSSILAGEVNTWKFIYTPAVSLPKGTLLKFDIGSKGRTIDWQVPEVSLKEPSNIIYGLLENGKVIQAKAVDLPHSYVPQYEFSLPQEVPAGSTVTICIGAPKGKDLVKFGNKAQDTLQRRRPFLLYIDTSGKGNYQDPETFSVDIKGNILDTIRILAPSITTKNRRFDVVLRFEDEFGNLTNNAPEQTLIELSHENLRENLKWKLFVPETGFIALPNLYFNEPGVYTIELNNVKAKKKYRSCPIKCFGTDVKNLFWGVLHGESERYDSTENIESCLRHFRDEKSVNFFAASPFENAEETSNDTWKHISQNIEELDEEERFTAFLGEQWVGEPKSEGVRQILFAKGEKSILRKKEQRSNTLKKIYKLFSPKEMISIPCFTMGKGFEYNFEDFNPEFERVVEIYNAWGSSECTVKEGNTRPIKGPAKRGINETQEGSCLKALLEGKRFGFVAGGLDDRGMYADFFENDQEQYTPGLTAIYADAQSRASIFDALYNRNCYATTGERIIMGLSLAGQPMGSELDGGQKPGLAINRHLSIYVAGTSPITKIELIRNGEVLKEYQPNEQFVDFTYDDMENLADCCIMSKEKKPFVFYYLRVTQEDGHMGWTSPIWVDFKDIGMRLTSKKSVPVAKKPVAKKPVKKK